MGKHCKAVCEWCVIAGCSVGIGISLYIIVKLIGLAGDL